MAEVGIISETGLAELLEVTVTQPADEELMQVVIPPAERGLDDVMR